MSSLTSVQKLSRKRNPREDLLTFGVNAEVDGVKMTDDEVLGFAPILTCSSAGWTRFPPALACNSGIWPHQEDQASYRANPDLIPDAIEEMLRAYAAVSTFRTVIRLRVNGVTMMPGDKVIMSTTLAGRDPAAWPKPDRHRFYAQAATYQLCQRPAFVFGIAPRAANDVCDHAILKEVPQFRLAPGAETGFIWA